MNWRNKLTKNHNGRSETGTYCDRTVGENPIKAMKMCVYYSHNESSEKMENWLQLYKSGLKRSFIIVACYLM